MKKFKTFENSLIWESYGNKSPDAQYSQEQYPEDAEAIISMEPVGPLDTGTEEDLGDDMFGEEDELDNEIITKCLRKLVKRANILLSHCESEELETWMVAKIIKAEDYISDVWNELDDVADFANDGFEDSDNISM
jgi:hypothetical protein